MSKITDIKILPLQGSKYIDSVTMQFSEDGVKRSWDIARTHDSVSILIYNIDRDSFIFVKQFRPALYLKNSDGFSVELCAGIVDKNIPLKDIASEEIFEETGYKTKNIKKISSFYSSLGISASKETMYYAIVSDSDLLGKGGGIDHENISLVYIKRKEVDKFLYDESIAKSSGVLLCVNYFVTNKLYDGIM